MGKSKQLYSLNLQRKVFRIYVDSVEGIQIEKEKDIEFAANYHKSTKTKKSFYCWCRCYEFIDKKNKYLNGKCDKYLEQKRKRILKSQFKWLLCLFHDQVNEKRDIQVSAQYNNYVLSKVFVEWKLYIKTIKYKSKLMTKSLSSLRRSVIIRNHGNNNKYNNKLSLSQSSSYIRLSNQSLTFKNKEFNNYLRIKNNNNEQSYNHNDYDFN